MHTTYKKSGENARRRAATWVLWGCVLGTGLGLISHISFAWYLSQPITWRYVFLTGLIGIFGLYALSRLKQSLNTAMMIFAWGALFAVGGLILYELSRERAIILLSFLLHIGIFSLSLILGFKPAIQYAIVVVIFLLVVGLAYNEIYDLILPLILAVIVALPGKVVENLIEESTSELARMNELLRTEIVERKQAQAELQEHQEHLEERVAERTAELQKRNEELDAFAHTVAHDLKSPLSTLVGFSKLLEMHYESMEPEKRAYAVDAIAQTGRKMTVIIDELLLLSSVRKIDEVALGAVDMGQVVEEALQRLDDMVKTNQPDLVLPDTWPVLWGYAPWLEEVWVNYISNAIKYGGKPDEGIPPRVELGYESLKPLHHSQVAAQHTRNPGEMARLSSHPSALRFWVRDNGQGLTPEEQARLFTPFTRLDQVRAKGHGLGLSIVRRIVEKLDGEVSVESQPGKGSTFCFILPQHNQLLD